MRPLPPYRRAASTASKRWGCDGRRRSARLAAFERGLLRRRLRSYLQGRRRQRQSAARADLPDNPQRTVV
eukprot:6180400-Pleurochrysis_carterae.AAC.2